MDYSEWLTPERLAVEEALWSESIHVGEQSRLVIETLQEFLLGSVMEFGCATGWLPHYLGRDFDYVGVDANADCLAMAREKCPGRIFVQRDVRTYDGPKADLVVAFAFLKHFELREWDDVVKRVLSFGRYGLFSVPVASECREDDCEFPHVWVTRARLEQAVVDAGHEIVRLPWGEALETEWMVLTKAID